MVMLEAGSRGVPVVATHVGAIPEVINEDCGYLATLAEFAETLDEIVNNPQTALIKGRKLRELIAKDFSLNSMVDQHVAIYENLTYG